MLSQNRDTIKFLSCHTVLPWVHSIGVGLFEYEWWQIHSVLSLFGAKVKTIHCILSYLKIHWIVNIYMLITVLPCHTSITTCSFRSKLNFPSLVFPWSALLRLSFSRTARHYCCVSSVALETKQFPLGLVLRYSCEDSHITMAALWLWQQLVYIFLKGWFGCETSYITDQQQIHQTHWQHQGTHEPLSEIKINSSCVKMFLSWLCFVVGDYTFRIIYIIYSY